uniref:Uncharacterized protein n=1 Tax=Ascaris lumbricoides TaxID=6252 RepID=A0A0M3HET8_ASCLU
MIFIANVLKSTYSHILTLGVVYFQCADKHGIFAPPHRVRLLIEVSKPLQHVRGEAAMRDRDACVARRRRASIPVYKKLKSTLESVATSEHLSKESKSKLPATYVGDDVLLMKTHEGGPATPTVQSAMSASAKRLQNNLLKTANAGVLIAASPCSTAPRRKQRRLSPRPTIFSDMRKSFY